MEYAIGFLVTVIGGVIVWWLTEGRKTDTEKNLKELENKKIKEIPFRPILNNLPGRTYFIGRKKKIDELIRLLSSRERSIIIEGIGGIGKTALALEVAHFYIEVAEENEQINKDRKESQGRSNNFISQIKNENVFIPDAIIWFTARERSVTIENLFDIICKTLGYEYSIRLPKDEKRENVFRILRSHNCLLIIDNYDTLEDNEIRDFLLLLPEPTKVIITSRWKNFCNAFSVSLGGLNQKEAFQLIRKEAHRLGFQFLENASEDSLKPLIKATGGAPLAIKWAIGQMKQKGQSYKRVLNRIDNAEGDIFKKIFERSWDLLSDQSRLVLLTLALFNKAVSFDTLKLALGVSRALLEDSISQLVEMWLIEPRWLINYEVIEYSITYLTRIFALDKMRDHPKLSLRSKNAVILWSLNMIREYGDHSWEGYDWDWKRYTNLDSDIENFLGSLDLTLKCKRYKELIEMVKGLIHYFGVRGLLNERIKRSQQCLLAAQILKDEEAEAWLYIAGFGWTYIQQGLYDSALSVIQKGYKLAKKMKLLTCLTEAHRHLGVIFIEQNNYSEAEKNLEKALSIVDIQRIKARIHCDLGRLAERIGNNKLASEEYQISLDMSLESDDYWGKLVTALYLAELNFKNGDYCEAKNSFIQARDLGMEVNANWVIANAQFGLAKIHIEEREFLNARNLLELCIKEFEKLGMLEKKKKANELLCKIP